MNYQITQKLAAVVMAVLMNALMLGSVTYLFAAPATAMSQPGHDVRVTGDGVSGVA